MGGGGDSGPSTSTTYTSSIPKELVPYATKVLGQADAYTSQQTYQPYTGQQVSGFNPLQQQAFGNIQQMQPSQYLNSAGALAGMAGTNQFTGANVNQYMSPYVNDVVAQQQQGAIRDYARQLPGMASNATKAGALGGSRSAILEGEAQSNLQNQLGNIRATGLQNAFQNAQGQFNTSNQNQLAAAGILGNVGQNQYNQQMGINQAQLSAGNQMQGQEQIALNTAYQNYMNQQNFLPQQLSFMNSLIRGTPVQMSGQYNYQSPPTAASQMAGLGLGAYGLSQAFGGFGGSSSTSASGGKAQGGPIKGYREGGIVSLAGGGDVASKVGAVQAEFSHVGKQNPGMAPDKVAAKVQQTVGALPNSIDWHRAYDLYNYTKTHPAAPTPPPPDSVVVQMAKQIAHQSDAEKMAAQQGVAGLPAQNVGQNYTPTGITAEPQAHSDGVAGLPADNVGNNYANGGIVAFNGEDDDQEVEGGESWVDRSDKYFRDYQARQAAADARHHMAANGIPLPAVLAQTPKPAATTPTTAPAAVPPGQSALQSTTAPIRPEMFNAAPFAQTSAAKDTALGVPAGSAMAAFNQMYNVRPSTKTAASDFSIVGAPVDDSRYTTPNVATSVRGRSGSAARPVLGKGLDIPEVEDNRMTPDEYFKMYQGYKEKSGLDKATSDMNKFLDLEHEDAAKEAKTDKALALAMYGFDIASTPGGLLRGVAAGGKGYVSAISSINKEQRATEKSLAKTRLDMQQALAKEDMNAWTTGLNNYREDSKNLATLNMQRTQIQQSAYDAAEGRKIQLYNTDVMAGYYRTLSEAAKVKHNATLEKYQGLFGNAIDKYAQTGDPRDKQAADHYQQVIQTLTDPSQVKAGAALTAGLAKDPDYKAAEAAYQMAVYSGDQELAEQKAQELAAARQAVEARFNFTTQLGSAQGTGLGSLGASSGGYRLVDVQ